MDANDLFDNCPRIGMGCWAIGGVAHAGGVPVGFAGADDNESRRTIEAAWNSGVRLFDTAAAYGAGHSERLLGQTIGNRPEAILVTKFGPVIDEEKREIVGEALDPASIRASVLASRQRLRRDRIELVLCHKNALESVHAPAVFDTLEQLREEGVVRAYGWSTDYPDRLKIAADYPGFIAVEHAMNIYFDAPGISSNAEQYGLTQLIRSPLAMGLLTGKFSVGDRLDASDVRSNTFGWMDYFKDGVVSEDHLERLERVRGLITDDGRTIAQGALCWLLARSPAVMPIPGAKTVRQAEENARSMEFGPLSDRVMAEIERLMERPPEGPPRER